MTSQPETTTETNNKLGQNKNVNMQKVKRK